MSAYARAYLFTYLSIVLQIGVRFRKLRSANGSLLPLLALPIRSESVHFVYGVLFKFDYSTELDVLQQTAEPRFD